jgi:hypothetical protein
MGKTYSFTVSVDELKNYPVLQDIIVLILKQTIECGYFIQEYTRSNFGGMLLVYCRIVGSMIDGQLERAIVNSISDVDGQITKFCTVFADLRKNFDSRTLVHVALVVSRMASSIDAIRGYL